MKTTVYMCLTAVVWAGCVTAPAPQTGTSVAGYVGDRASVEMNEIIATVRLPGDDKPYRNLHVTLGVVINPRKVTVYQPYEVESIIRRLEPRLSAEVLKLTLANTFPVADLSNLRERIRVRAAEIINEAMAQWTEAAAYEVRPVVSSLYLTDGSVGKARGGGNRWW